MDLSKLKKRPSFPFETIAVAISFSDTCQFVLAEAKNISDVCGASLVLLHIGEKTKSKETELDKILINTGIDARNVRIIWMEGEPVETILRLCKLNIVDLLVLGALKKENILKFYLGSIARNISRKAKCSVLLLTNPVKEVKKYKKLVVNGTDNKKTIHTINTSLYFSKKMHVSDVIIVNETDTTGLAIAMADDSTAPQSKVLKKNQTDEMSEYLHSIIEKCDAGDVNVTDKIIKGKPGYAIKKFAKDKKADLLVINSPDTNLNVFDRIFTHDIEYILADLPCNVLIVHSRV